MRELLQQALDAICEDSEERVIEVAQKIRAALAQPAPTGNAPCARHCEATAFQSEIRRLEFELRKAQPAPAVRKPLSQAQLFNAYCNTLGIHQFVQAFVAGARYAEAHHGITGDGK